MKITKERLKQIIKEELSQVLNENPEVEAAAKAVIYSAKEKGIDLKQLARGRNLQKLYQSYYPLWLSTMWMTFQSKKK